MPFSPRSLPLPDWCAGLAVVLIVLLAGSDPIARAQESPHTALSGQVELARLVDLSAERLRLQIDYEASALKGTVTLRLTESLSDEELWALTNRILASRGFASVCLPGANPKMLSIVKLADAPGMAKLEDSFDQQASSAGYVSVVTRIQHQPAKAIVEALKLVLSKPGGSITELGVGGLVLISDLEPRVNQALELIQTLDVPGPQPVIEKIPTQFVGATSLASLVTAAAMARDAITGAPLKGKVIAVPDGSAVILVCTSQEAAHWRELVSRFDERELVVTQTYSPRHFGVAEVGKLIEQTIRGPGGGGLRGSGDQWRMIVDDLTGTLVVSATPSEHDRIVELMQRLDSMPAEARRPLKVFAIRNRSVTQIVEVLMRLVEAGVLDAGEIQTLPIESDAPDQARSVERIPAPPLVADSAGISRATSEHTNAVQRESETASPTARQPSSTGPNAIVPRTLRGDKEQKRPSLTLTADEGTNTLIAVGEPRLIEQLDDLIRRLDVRQPQVMLEVMVVSLSEADTLDLGVELKKIELSGSTAITLSSLFGLGTPLSGIPSSIPAGRGFSGVVLSPGDFSVVIRALQTLNLGRTLSLPKVLVNNNQQATLDSVLQQPFISTNASDTVATTSFGGSDNAGTVITIKPQIAEGDHLILEYTVTLSAFVGEAADPSVPPPKQSNNLSSVVTIPDGYTVVVGGLESVREADGVSQVPILGSIPLLGEAFKSRSQSSTKSRFYVFIRSEVLRHEGFEDLKYLSDRDAAASGVDDGWPQVEPQVIK